MVFYVLIRYDIPHQPLQSRRLYLIFSTYLLTFYILYNNSNFLKYIIVMNIRWWGKIFMLHTTTLL